MGRAKEIEVRVIPSSIANPFIRRHHYSHKVVNKSNLHFGAFLDGKLHGVMSYGTSLDKAKMQGLVEGTGWNEFLELNRMAFDEYLPRNSESRCIGLSLRLIMKNGRRLNGLFHSRTAAHAVTGQSTVQATSCSPQSGRTTTLCSYRAGRKSTRLRWNRIRPVRAQNSAENAITM